MFRSPFIRCISPADDENTGREGVAMSKVALVRRRTGRSSISRLHKPIAEALERRIQLTTFLVTNTLDSGAGSFRQAIIDANAANSADTISFDTAGTFATPQTI